jgi:hypothetical protein
MEKQRVIIVTNESQVCKVCVVPHVHISSSKWNSLGVLLVLFWLMIIQVLLPHALEKFLERADQHHHTHIPSILPTDSCFSHLWISHSLTSPWQSAGVRVWAIPAGLFCYRTPETPTRSVWSTVHTCNNSNIQWTQIGGHQVNFSSKEEE